MLVKTESLLKPLESQAVSLGDERVSTMGGMGKYGNMELGLSASKSNL